MEKSLVLTGTREKIECIWSLVRDANIREARKTSEQLVRDVQAALEETGEDDSSLFRAYCHACHAAGYTVAMNLRNRNLLPALQYFQQMEKSARSLQEEAPLVIALTYQGDIYRRRSAMTKALAHLQDAYTHPTQSDPAAHGNCAQLLGRVYFRLGDQKNFKKVMEEAEQIASTIDPIHNSLHGQYCLGTVYIDHARFCSEQGHYQQALDYLQKAEEELPSSIHWQTLLTARRGILLVRSGDIHEGMPYVLRALQLCRDHGNERLLDHFSSLELFLSQKAVEISEAKIQLGDALNGSADF